MKLQVSAALALCAALIAPAHSEDKFTLRYGEIANSARGISTLGINIAQRKGFLEREGIDFKVVGLRGTSFQVEALDKGDVEVVNTALPYLIQAVLKGSPAVAVAGTTANPIYSLVAKPEIRNFADLKGKLIGLSLPIDTISISTRRLLALKGLGEADYRVKELVGSPARGECLKSGECDSVPLGQPDDLVLAAQGFQPLGVTTDAVASFQFEVIAARRDFAQSHADVVTGFVRALADAFRFIRDPAHRDDVAKAIVDITGASDQIARATLKLYFEPDRGVLPKAAEIDLKGISQVIAFMAEGGTVKPPLPAPEQFVDPQYLHAAGAQ